MTKETQTTKPKVQWMASQPVILLQWTDPCLHEVIQDQNNQWFTVALLQKSMNTPFPTQSGLVVLSPEESEDYWSSPYQFESDFFYYRKAAIIEAEDSDRLQALLQMNVTHVFSTQRKTVELIDHFQLLWQHKCYIDPLLQQTLIEEIQQAELQKAEEEENQLTLCTQRAACLFSNTQILIINELLKGKNNLLIAKECYIAPSTVNNHISYIARVLQANDRTHIVKRVIELDLLR
ncbi:helix-turn-helix transcriptional regulator [Salsuginibacillus kocurii]|uniref:helix-turn-helix transcriptional regulator n=1 Tax=Salsuginibacillus kocurii TaxID=427078 RepID=UPI0003808C2D|nr:LuxR C-terminal-related transcriptional regulator [Salsuginibacillus kocurii]